MNSKVDKDLERINIKRLKGTVDFDDLIPCTVIINNSSVLYKKLKYSIVSCLTEKLDFQSFSLFSPKASTSYYDLTLPTSNPVSLSQKNLDNNIFKYPYHFTEKSDGIRYYLLFFTYNRVQMCIMIDRKWNMFLIDMFVCDEQLFDYSLFDGELVERTVEYQKKNNSVTLIKRNIFMVFDTLVYKGKNVMSQQLPWRIRKYELHFKDYDSNRLYSNSTIQSLKQKIHALNYSQCIFYNPNIINQLVIENKKHYEYTRDNALHDKLSSFNHNRHKRDGLVFTPSRLPINIGKQNTLFKWKKDHTIDLLFGIEKIRESLFFCFLYGMQTMEEKQQIEPMNRLKMDIHGHNVHLVFVINISTEMYTILSSLNHNKKKKSNANMKKRGLMVGEFNIVKVTKGSPEGEPISKLQDIGAATIYVLLELVKIRKDKLHPNHYQTVCNSIKDSIENVQFEALLNCQTNEP